MQATQILNDSAQGPGIASNNRVGNATMGKDEFVKLLLAQLGNQDPTTPMDSQAFVAQLAQFSSLEQLNTVNERLDSLLVAQTSTSQTAATTFVGKEATFKTDKLALGADGAALASGSLSADADTVAVNIVDGQGKTVRTLQIGAQHKGDFTFQWDGRDDNGARVAAGDYQLKVTAADSKGKTVETTMRSTGLVNGVSFQNGYPELLINGSKIKMSEIVEINQRSTP